MREDAAHRAPTLAEALPVYVKIGLLSFGGPAGQIALMQSEIVERRGWVAGTAFDRGLSFSMMLPGPEAQQLATWLGWRLHGIAGGLAAGLAFIIPGAALMILLAWLAAAKGDLPLVAAVFYGVQPVVIAIVLKAMEKLAGRALKGRLDWTLAAAAFVGIAIAGLPFPLIVALAAVAGLLAGRETGGAAEVAPGGPFLRGAIGAAGIYVALALGVFLTVRLALGDQPFTGVAELFTTAAFVTFGGAYALLPYVAERAVETYGWLTPEQMLNGLAIAEATPGPLILVNTYAGFFAGWSTGGAATGILTGTLATFYTFAPSFMLILAFAPVVERVQAVPWARRALAGISAAVVGVIANLAVFLGEAAFFPAGLTEPDWMKLALFAAALWLVFRTGLGVVTLVLAGAAAGVVAWGLGLAPLG